MGFQDDLNADLPGHTWVNEHGTQMGIGRCLMGPLRDITNPRYPVEKTYAVPSQALYDEAREQDEGPTMDIVNAMFERREWQDVWKCLLGSDCGRFQRTSRLYSYDQASCQTPQLPV